MVLEGEDSSLKPKITYHPRGEENQLSKFRKFVEHRYNIKLKDYWELHEWSCKYYPEFWECVWQYFGMVCSAPYIEVYDRNRSFDNMEWFRGAQINYAEDVFKYRDSHIALIAIDSADNMQCMTYRELYNEVCIYAAALKNLGIKKGDVVACYIPNKIEPVFAFLAAASLGALWCGSLPLLGAKSTVLRFQQVAPKVLFTSGNFCFEGNEINMMEKLKEVVSGLPMLKKVVFIPSKMPGVVEDIESIQHSCTITEFLEASRNRFSTNPWDLEFEQVPFDYPLNVSFTSGTTGLPKSLLHSHGSFFASLKDYGLCQDITRKDVLINFSPVGWISWNMFINCLHLGVTLCMYEGMPFDETPTRFWDLVDKLKISSSYIWSSTVEDMEKKGYLPTERHSLESLKQIFPVGSIMKAHSYDFFARIKPGMFVDSAYGVTEVYGLISGLDSNMPVYRGEHQCFSVGMDVKCLDINGKEVIGERGSLVIANPYPAMPIGLLNDDTKEMVEKTYLSQYPGYWNVSDDIWINPVTKGFVVYGRWDNTLNPKGARFNSTEIYFALGDVKSVYDSVCVSQLNEQGDERVVLFVKMKPGVSLNESIKKEIRNVIERNLTYEHVPNIIMEVADIPYNLTGKKMDILVKQLINKMPVGNIDFVVNPACVDFYQNVNLGSF